MSLSKSIGLILFLVLPIFGFSQTLYTRTFGQKGKPAILFLHGGPGYNSASFEATTAQVLADSGFFVIVYDRRGEGRSKDKNAAYSFDQSIEDINHLLDASNIDKVHLMGHSFGGMLATEYSKRFPEKVNSIILVSAPINLQESFKTIISSCRKIYTEKKDSVNLNYISMLETMDTTSLQYSSYAFMHAMSNGFYSPDSLSEGAKVIYKNMKTDTLAKYMLQMGYKAPQGFWKNEHYTTLDLSDDLGKIKANNSIPIYGIYGKEDGLYAPQQLNKLEKILGKENIMVFPNCSHSVFIDRQETFISTLVNWLEIP